VIEELRNYADELQQEDRRKERLGLSAEELAFYDAIATNTETEIDDELLQRDSSGGVRNVEAECEYRLDEPQGDAV